MVRLRRSLAELLFTLNASKVLVRPLLTLLVVTLLGAVLHRSFGAAPGQGQPAWDQALFVSYNLLFLEHVAALPAHPIGQLVQYVQPLVGILVAVEGVIRLGVSVFRKEDNREVWMEILAKTTRDHVILCGLGTVGFRVLEELITLDRQVFAVERDPDSPMVERARALGAEVFIADARVEGVLDRLNVRAARAVIIATDDDLANMEIALDVRELDERVPIVLRLFDQRLAKKVRHTLGIEVSFSTSRLAAPLLASAALDPSVVGAHTVGGQKLVTMQVDVAGLAGKKVAELSAMHMSPVALDQGEGWQVQPSPSLKLKAGDRLQVMVRGDRVPEVHDLNT